MYWNQSRITTIIYINFGIDYEESNLFMHLITRISEYIINVHIAAMKGGIYMMRYSIKSGRDYYVADYIQIS